MERVFRAIAVTICGWIYPLIPPLYEVFYDLAGARYFTDSTMNDLASNLYILVSVVMLFTFAVQLIKAIVNPDLLTDKQKGMGNVFKRSIIAMILIVGVPIAFNEIYKMQGQVLENHLIEKIVVGFNSGDTKPGDTNVGQVLAASTIVDLLYPVEGASTISSNLPTYYNDMITKDIKNIDKVGLYINERYSPSGDEITDDDPYVFEFKPLVAIVAGALVLYFMVIFSMDMGVRLLKLALLELTAPISIMAYIYGGDDNLKRWTKEVGTTFLEVYVKIGIIAFIIFILNNIDSFGTRIQSNHPWMIKLFILIGLFTLAGKLPELIKMLFGITYTPKGGIGGRLGAMVGPVGNIAQGAWNRMRNPIAAATTVAAGVGAAGAHLAAAGRSAINRGREVSDRIGQRTGHQGIGRALGTAAGLLRFGGGAVGSLGAGYRGVRSGNLNEIGNASTRYNQTHPEGSTFLGRTADAATSALGFGTAQERHDRRATSYDMFVDQNGNYFATAGAGRNAIRLNQEQLDAQRNIYNNIQARRTAIRDAATHSLERENSDLRTTIQGTTGNYHQLSDALNNLRNSGPQRGNYTSDAAYRAALTAHQNQINAFENSLRAWHDGMRDAIVDNTIQGTGAVDTNGAQIDITGSRDGNLIINSSTVLNQTLRDHHITDQNGTVITAANDTITLNNLNTLADNQIGLFDTMQQTQEQRNIQEQRSDTGRRRQANDQAYHAGHDNRNRNN